MPIYIYRGGSPNPQPQNPLVRFLVSAAILAVIVGLGVLLLPVIGAIALLILGFIALLIVGGVIYRWIYGNPIEAKRTKRRGEDKSGRSSRSATSQRSARASVTGQKNAFSQP